MNSLFYDQIEDILIDINFVVVIFTKLKHYKEVHYKALFKIG